MKQRFLFTFLAIFMIVNSVVFGQNSATISKVLEYRPAPGQHINRFFPPLEESDTYEHALAYANRVLVENNHSMIGLGAFGGYIIVGFDHSIVNVKGQYDFRAFGNAFVNGAEPGIVMVCQDLNKNGQPDSDEIWYELAGSEYKNNQTIKNYEITYYRPNNIKTDVKWTDNQGGSGTIKHISYATQNHIYPNWITEDKITFKGTKLPNNIVKNGTFFNLLAFDYGYVDNQLNSSSIEKNGFKIDWAVDKNGNPVQLDYIDFIRVHTGQLQQAGSLGETSTELRGIEDLHPNAQLFASIYKHSSGKTELLINSKILTISNVNHLIEIAILDLTGKECCSVQNQNSINLENLPNGIYIVHLRLNNNQIILKKIIL